MQKKLTQNKQKGFMLVELSVVIAVLAMLTAATFVTMQMIDQAHDRSVMQQLTKIHEACNIFFAQYGGLPGDLSDASTAVKTGLTDGNGDGKINKYVTTKSGTGTDDAEGYIAWAHLNAAKTGIAAYSKPSAATTELVAGTHGPKTKRNAMIGLVYNDVAESNPGDSSSQQLNANVIMIFKPIGASGDKANLALAASVGGGNHCDC